MKSLIALSLLLICAVSCTAGPAKTAASEVFPVPTPTPEGADKGKKNSRPEQAGRTGVVPSLNGAAPSATPVYFYEFSRPGFTYAKVTVEHDEDGRGKIGFLKDGFEETITDPIALSPVTLTKVKQLITDLDFLNSTEEYQYERDYSHLGNVTFTVRKGGRERTVRYNWTVNKSAKELMDEYRRISNEYTWLFEFNVARVNQPLMTPSMIEALDGYLRRSEISNPVRLIPFLTEAAGDEKLPLIARNHATKLIKQIEKSIK
jgi:hypothetical protein